MTVDRTWRLTVHCCYCNHIVDGAGPAVAKDPKTQRWRWLAVLEAERPGQRSVCHFACFVARNGKAAAYVALGREAWAAARPILKTFGNAIGN